MEQTITSTKDLNVSYVGVGAILNPFIREIAREGSL